MSMKHAIVTPELLSEITMATRPQLSDEQIATRFLKKKTPPPEAQNMADDSMDAERFAHDMSEVQRQQGALAVAKKEQNERVTALAVELNYQGSTELAVLENSARDAIRRIGMGIFELGGYLLLLKEGVGSAGIASVWERLGISQPAASKYMSITRRFATYSTSNNLEKLGFSKMAELLPLDDSQLDDLVDEGQTGELALDDVSRMSVKELRAAVRKERADLKATEDVLVTKNKTIDKLQRDVKRIEKLPPDEQLNLIKKEAIAIASDAEAAVLGGLRQALLKLNDHDGGEYAKHGVFMAGLVGQVQAQLNALREEFNLPDVSSADAQQLTAEMAEWDKA